MTGRGTNAAQGGPNGLAPARAGIREDAAQGEGKDKRAHSTLSDPGRTPRRARPIRINGKGRRSLTAFFGDLDRSHAVRGTKCA